MTHQVRPTHMVVSLGTGRIPTTPVSTCDVFRPGGLIELYNVVQGASSLGKLLVEQVSIFRNVFLLPYRNFSCEFWHFLCIYLEYSYFVFIILKSGFVS